MTKPTGRDADHLVYAEQLPIVEASLPMTFDVRKMAPDDRRYAATTWRESYKEAPRVERMPWPLYKQTAGKVIDQLVEADDTSMIAAYAGDGHVLGWIAYTPGRSISTVHWTYTRRLLGTHVCRRRGVMSALLGAAELGPRFAYTHRGARRQNGTRGRGPGLDVILSEMLRTKGVTAVYVPVEEWLR